MRVPRLSFALLTAVVALSVTAWTLAARAQPVSEADRQAARELFQQGYQLQQSGHYTEALDKFSRAQTVVSAPTNLLHIAECQAQLGLLVEAAETYRGLISLTLPADAPAAFRAAQTQGAAEIQQIEARVPKVRIEVVPVNPPGLAVTIDDQPMNTALVGVDRPIDPGPHKIAVVASGYGREEKTVVIREKEPPQLLSFALQAVVVPKPEAPPPAQVFVPAPIPPPPAYAPYPGPFVQPYGAPPYAPAVQRYIPPKKDYTDLGFFVGGRIGASVPTGDLVAGEALSDVSLAGVSFDFEGYFRFGHKWFLGAYGGHDFFRGTSTVATSSGNNLGGAIGFITNPEGVGLLLDLKLGYRWYGIQGSEALDLGGPDGTYTTVEVGGAMGVWIAAGKFVRIVPLVDIMAGSLSPPSGSEQVTQSGYAVFFAGIAAYANFDIKQKED
jgi:hypothetical protein